MQRSSFSLGAILAALAALGTMLAPATAAAQSMDCQQIAKHLTERQEMVASINKLGKKVDPRKACTAFRSLASNGEKIVAFIEENQSWCQIPDEFANGMKEDHKKTTDLRDKACKIAAQVNEMEKQAKQQAQQGQRGVFGGPGLTGEYQIPRGAL